MSLNEVLNRNIKEEEVLDLVCASYPHVVIGLVSVYVYIYILCSKKIVI